MNPGNTTSEHHLAWITLVLQVAAGVLIYRKTGQIPDALLVGLGIPSAGYSVSRGMAKRPTDGADAPPVPPAP